MSNIQSKLINLNGNVTGTLAIVHGGTGQSTAVSVPAASTYAAWDTSKNMSANAFIPGYATTVTAAATTTLTLSSAQQQYFTGTTTQTVQMPAVSALVTGQYYTIVNNSTGAVTVQSSGGNTIVTMAGSSTAILTCISTSGTTAASWNFEYALQSTAGTVTSVAASGGTTGMSFTGSPITTSGTLTLTGTLAIANGGTGQTSASAAFNALSPVTTTGDMIYSASGATNSRLPIGTSGQLLVTVAGVPTWTSTVSAATTFSSGIVMGGTATQGTLNSFIDWTDYTPTVKTGATTTTISIQSSRYSQVGKLVTFICEFSITNFNAGSGNITVSVPITRGSANPDFGVGAAVVTTNSLGNVPGALQWATTTTVNVFQVTAANNVVLTNATAATLGASNQIAFAITYEAASN